MSMELGALTEGTIKEFAWRYWGNRQHLCQDSRSPCLNLNSRAHEYKARVLRFLSQHSVRIFVMPFRFVFKSPTLPVTNSSNLAELKYSEVPIGCISTVTIYRKARLREPNHLFTPSHYGVGLLSCTASDVRGSGIIVQYRLKNRICVCLIVDKEFINKRLFLSSFRISVTIICIYIM
jgi:hypothetical protein